MLEKWKNCEGRGKGGEAAKKRGATTLVGGDFNAEIGGRQPGEPESIIGTHADGTRNRRGEMMAKWAWASKLTIVNSRFQKPWGKSGHTYYKQENE